MNLIGIIAVSIPVVAIVGGYWLRYQKMLLEKHTIGKNELKMLQQIQQDNIELKKRVESLEGIVTGIDPELLSLKPSAETNKEIQIQLESLIQKLKKD